MKKETSFPTKFITALAILAATAIVLLLLGRIGSVLVYFAIAAVISYLLNPLVDRLEKHRVPRGISILVLFTLFAGGVTAVIIVLAPKLAHQTKLLIDNFPEYAKAASAWAQSVMGRYSDYIDWAKNADQKWGIADKAALNLQKTGTQLFSNVFKSVMGFFSYLPGLVIIPVLVYYFLSGNHEMKASFIAALPEHWRDDAGRLMDRLNRAIGGFLGGQIKLCLYIGVLAWVGSALIARLPYSLIIGFIAGATEFIPYLGPILGMIMPLTVAAFIGWQKALLVFIIFMVIQLIENNLLAPRVMSSDVGMHPLLIMFILMAAGQAAGIPGMLVALPVAVIVKAFYEHFYVEKYLKKAAQPAATAEAEPAPETAGQEPPQQENSPA